ncbi:MAG TPA: immunoglobulin domain-containing protein [Candidatus Acidoferrum sp.]|nr:immunoglobulin domain-containing protein [Candidatus Acidoferrum sp.]
MKNKIATLLLALAGFSIPLASRADVIWYEGFNYNPPVSGSYNLTNVSGGIWTNFSGSGLHDMYLPSNSHLEVATTTAPNGIDRKDDDCRFLSLTNNSQFTNTTPNPPVLYASFTVICTNLPNAIGSYFASFYNTTRGFAGRVQAFTSTAVLPNTWRLGVTAATLSTNPIASGGFPVDLALNTPYQVVEELDPTPSGLQAATIWVNPIDPNDTGTSSTDPKYTSNDSLGYALTTFVNAYAFRQAGSFGNGFWVVTNLVLANTFGDALTNCFPTNAYPPTIVYQPGNVTNFTGSSFNLSAVANGQGLGNLTYQWRQNSNNFANPNGNSNILPFSSVAAGTNYYDLVVTTPFGLSVTSAEARVAISAAPVPPTFITQPVSQSVYRGQTVILTASVASPGNVTFTWYSNNVVVTAGVNSSGDSSSLQLDNVTTNFSASYKVAATNDVVVNGVVSTNAVLTVQNPAHVSVAYLRTLVDPVTYQPTNVPPSIPYEVTGTVTTYTNITTGNTASYYLQDGTGGINIFATLASTFRPAQGAVVTFVGVLSSFTSGIELYADPSGNYPYTSYTDTGNTAPLPAPIAIPYTILSNPNYANYVAGGSLVQITNAYFGARAGTATSTTANDFVGVTNTAGEKFTLFFPYLDLDVAGQTLPSFAYTVTGVLYSYGGIVTNEMVVTRWSDVVTTLPTPIPLNATFSSGSATFTWSDASFLLQDSTNVLGPYNTIIGATSPFTTNTTSHPTLFFRLYHP